MKNFLAKISYDGTDFSGWQIQKEGRTIQQVLENALSLIAKEEIKTTSAGDIYNEFSAGVKDPGAIRNYLKYCWENRTYKPSCVLLMGDGNYDPREIIFKGKDRDLIPTFQIDDEREIS